MPDVRSGQAQDLGGDAGAVEEAPAEVEVREFRDGADPPVGERAVQGLARAVPITHLGQRAAVAGREPVRVHVDDLVAHGALPRT
jgi:hypothetical protein